MQILQSQKNVLRTFWDFASRAQVLSQSIGSLSSRIGSAYCLQGAAKGRLEHFAPPNEQIVSALPIHRYCTTLNLIL